jgi:hypothetical protein
MRGFQRIPFLCADCSKKWLFAANLAEQDPTLSGRAFADREFLRKLCDNKNRRASSFHQ